MSYHPHHRLRRLQRAVQLASSGERCPACGRCCPSLPACARYYVIYRAGQAFHHATEPCPRCGGYGLVLVLPLPADLPDGLPRQGPAPDAVLCAHCGRPPVLPLHLEGPPWQLGEEEEGS